jgi:tRNA/rRNA methyltransferase
MESPAVMAELEGLIGHLEGSLEEAGYFYPPDRVQATKTTLRTILTKPQWSNREIQALRGVIRALSGHRSSKN